MRVYKCFPYYTVCTVRGKEIVDELHYTNGGRIYHYYECLSQGIYPSTQKPCRYCIYTDNGKTNHYLVTRKQRRKHGEPRLVRGRSD